ncbi:hypothetical protein GCM10010329_85120 [Streptomyces spiroverticillatus]|uniref:Uncharacterized protein n=1 Tax=Streptomyces finlayi TaxID=67296 RepID=A0A919CG33_9ACTN|nr:hypothetical protein [Streptomyces finlayi]GHA49919.1 hypothetical protein GCM10010329_85120 [Streptomyces spiroverticillatus]GHD19542.1 hypothetical protein GCM10010334_83310 [Streptomyces finlayi]
MDNVFDLNVWVKEARREPFRFELSDYVFVLPAAASLDKKILRSVNLSAPSTGDIETLLKEGLAEQWQAFDALPLPLGALGELFRRWQAHEGAPVGESSASSNS